MDYKVSRRDDLDRQIEEVAFSDLYRPQVQKLACFRGISTLSAMTLITEIGDWRRFERTRRVDAGSTLLEPFVQARNRRLVELVQLSLASLSRSRFASRVGG